MTGNELPLLVAHGAIAFMFPKNWCGSRLLLPCENGSEAFAFERQDGVTVMVSRMLDVGKFDYRGHDVRDVAQLLGNAPRLFHHRWPAGDEGSRNATFVSEMFVQA